VLFKLVPINGSTMTSIVIWVEALAPLMDTILMEEVMVVVMVVVMVEALVEAFSRIAEYERDILFYI
jgi:hypothetical protein